MKLQKYMRGGLDVSEAEVGSLWTPYDDAQRALDAERARVKELEREAFGLAATQCSDPIAGEHGQLVCGAVMEWKRVHDQQLATIQAQLAAAKKVKADYDRWLSGGVYFTTAEYEKHVADHGQQVESLQAQLRQVEGERDALNGHYQRAYGRASNAEEALTALRQLVEALPVVKGLELIDGTNLDDIRGDAVLILLLEKTHAKALFELLRYRAILGAQDAGKEDVSHE